MITVIIVGPQGAGKSELAREIYALGFEPQGFHDIRVYTGNAYLGEPIGGCLPINGNPVDLEPKP